MIKGRKKKGYNGNIKTKSTRRYENHINLEMKDGNSLFYLKRKIIY
jgi:hypothetical protein